MQHQPTQPKQRTLSTEEICTMSANLKRRKGKNATKSNEKDQARDEQVQRTSTSNSKSTPPVVEVEDAAETSQEEVEDTRATGTNRADYSSVRGRRRDNGEDKQPEENADDDTRGVNTSTFDYETVILRLNLPPELVPRREPTSKGMKDFKVFVAALATRFLEDISKAAGIPMDRLAVDFIKLNEVG